MVCCPRSTRLTLEEAQIRSAARPTHDDMYAGEGSDQKDGSDASEALDSALSSGQAANWNVHLIETAALHDAIKLASSVSVISPSLALKTVLFEALGGTISR